MAGHRFGVTVCAIGLSVMACSGSTEPKAVCTVTSPTSATLVSTASAFSASATKLDQEDGVGPEGPFSECNVWVAIAPSASANAGVTVGSSTAVFVRSKAGVTTPAAASDLRVGDSVEVWRTPEVIFGSVEGPPGSPVYSATQLVIQR